MAPAQTPASGGFLASVLALEAVNPPFGVNYLLLPGVEGVALRAYVYVQALLRSGALRLEGVAAVACHRDLVALGVYVFLHVVFAVMCSVVVRRQILLRKAPAGQGRPPPLRAQRRGARRPCGSGPGVSPAYMVPLSGLADSIAWAVAGRRASHVAWRGLHSCRD